MACWLLLACLSCTETGPDSVAEDDAVDGDGDGFPAADDCDDADNTINPDAVELCDARDNDCDGRVDDADDDRVGGSDWYGDADGDGYGDATDPRTACERPAAASANADDCADDDAAVYPDAVETCDGADEDCDGRIDNACAAAPEGTVSLADHALLTGTVPGTWTGYATSGGRGDAEDHGVAVVATIDPYSFDCSANRVYVYDAPLPPTSDIGATAAAVVFGEAETGCVGFPVDVSRSGDADGMVDLLVDDFEGDTLYVFRGPLEGERTLSSAELTIVDGLESTWYSAWLGDVDGIPGAEVGVGDPNTFLGASSDYPVGEMRVFSAASDGALAADDASAHLRGASYDSYFGEWFGAVGDLDGDGIDEIAVNGRWFFYGPLAGDLTTQDAGIVLESYTDHDQYALFAAAGGDIDGDGRDDAVVAAWWGSGSFEELGAVVVSDGDRAVTHVTDLPIRLTTAFSWDDCANCGLATGDVDGDGSTDILLGGAGPNGSGMEEPAIHLEYGPFAGVREIGTGAVLTVPAAFDHAGSTWALSTTDLNGDGFDEILAGANPGTRDGLGAAYLVPGGPR